MDNVLGLSDDEFLKQNQEELSATEDSQESTDTVTPEGNITNETVSDESNNATGDNQEIVEEDTSKEELDTLPEDTQADAQPFNEDTNSESVDADSNKENTDTPEDKPQETDTFNYEDAYNQVTAPFKANGATMQVNSPEDIVRLMQMGAGAQKQMAKLKPNLKLIKMLENNNLLDERRLNNLIDLSKNDSKAIAKLVKDSGVDPDDIDIENASNYQPNNYTVTDSEYELDQVLDSIKQTDTFDKTIDLLTSEWDDKSKTFVSENPNVIKVINDHMLNGVYDRVNAIMQQDKALGKLTGVSDVDAYKQIVDMLASNGELIDGNQQVPVQSNVESIEDVDSVKRKQNRKAAAPTKQTNTSSNSKQDVSYLTLSDDEFIAKYA
jgi:hypothetical protein|tara:strand:+ start:4131 stop:5273 length:1143 start_codon:yes stop_codon:yes gene_type:complete